MPNIREKVVPGDHIFVVSGKVPAVPQYIIGGFEVAEIISANAAYERFPAYRLRRTQDGEITGNIIVNARGKQHFLDHHKNFDRRIKNYIVGRNAIVMATSQEIERARLGTLPFLHTLLGKSGAAPINVIGRNSKLNEHQVKKLLAWLHSLKSNAMDVLRKVA
jgi:hypothetical protein